MGIFVDSKKREWELEVTIGGINRVKSRCKLELLDFGKDGFLKTLIDDPLMQAEMFWALLEPQAKEQSITKDDFADSLTGEIIDDMTKVFLEEITDFFRGSKKTAAKTVLAKTNLLVETAYADVAEKAESLNVKEIYEEAIKND